MTWWQWATVLGIAAILALTLYAILTVGAEADRRLEETSPRGDEHYLAGARRMRLAFVSAAWLAGQITEEEGRALLRGPVRRGDPSTWVDDSALLGAPAERAMRLCGLPPGRTEVP